MQTFVNWPQNSGSHFFREGKLTTLHIIHVLDFIIMKQKEDIPVISSEEVIVGNPDAAVTVTEFVDYESEQTAKLHHIVKQLMEEFGDKVNFNFRHYPQTTIHQKAHKAAEAAIGAAQEGRFWEMHEILIQNRRHLGTVSLKLYAREAGAMAKSFLDDMINSKYGWFVQDDLKFGLELGITEVPAFLINGEKLDKKPTHKNLSDAIKAALKKRRLKKAA